MTFDLTALDFSLITPELMLLGLVFVALSLDMLLPANQKHFIGWVTVAGLVGCIAAAVPLWGVRDSFAGVVRIDEYAIFFKVTFLLTAIGITLISLDYVRRFLPQPGEYYALLVAATIGMVLMASANELLTAYLALELLSFASYVLVSYAKTNLKSNEAGLKYIILGGVSSGLLLYGISLIYGTLGTTYLPDVLTAVGAFVELPPVFVVAVVLVTAGLAFKVAAVPFHMWTPDVYEGAPTPITAFLSVGSKAAGFALVLRILVGGLLPLQEQYQVVFAVLAVLTMTLGNLVAIQQRNVKRLLAYSSIGQAGYVLVGIAALSTDRVVAEMATRGVMLHLLGYVFTNLAAFGAVIAMQNVRGGREMITDLAGFARRAPFASLAMMAALFSLAGMPLFAGFVTKFYLFAAAARAGLLWLVAIAVINSTISLYYYLLVLHEMYVRTPPGFEADGHLAHAAAPTPAAAVAMPSVYGTTGSPAATVLVAQAAGTTGPAALRYAPAAHSAGMVNGHTPDGHTTGHSTAAVDDRGEPTQAGRGRGGDHASEHDGHDGAAGAHDAHGGDHDSGPIVPWWRRSMTAEMPPEHTYPPHPISWSITAALFIFLAGIFYLGLYPRDVIDLLREASNALFSG